MIVALLLEDMLSDLGYQVVARAAESSQALAAIEAHDPDAAILDINLRGRLSYDVADALAARGVPFVFCSGYSGARVREDHRHRPSLQKPITQEELAAALAAAIRPRKSAHCAE